MNAPHREFQLPSDNQIRLFLTFLVGVGVAIYFGIKLGEGQDTLVFAIITGATVFFFMQALGSRYWLLAIFGATNLASPIGIIRDLTLQEVTSIAVVGMAVFRVLFRKQTFKIFRRDYVPILFLACWALLSYAKNPSGLAIFGGNVVGARFWIQLLLGLMVFFVFANCRVERRDVFWIITGVVFSNVFGSACTIIIYRTTFLETKDLYTLTQPLAGVATTLYILSLARYNFTELFSLKRLWFFPLITILSILTLMSGKRISLAVFVLIPLFSAFAHRQIGRALVVVIFVLGIFLFAAFGHTRLFVLSSSAQRALSVLPGNWDPEINLGSTDDFRELMRKVAYREIAKSPWFGRGFTLNLDEMFVERMMYGKGINENVGGSSAYAAGSWHNLWVGTSADLGIPAAFAYAAILIQSLFVSLNLCRATRYGDLYHSMAVWLFIATGLMVLTSWTGGTAQSLFVMAWSLGLIWAVRRTVREEASMPAPPSISERRHGLSVSPAWQHGA